MIEPGFKQLIWEFDPERKGKLTDQTRVEMKAGLRMSSETDKPTGYYFRWVVALQSEKGLFVHCVAEDSYTELFWTPPSADKVWNWMNHSKDQFLEKFQRGMTILGYEYHPDFNLTKEGAESLFQEFCRQS